MQKKILLVAVYFTLTGVCLNAQSKKQLQAPPAPPSPLAIQHLAPPPPPPPPPPLPALPPVETVPAIPPVPPVPPVPPTKESLEKEHIISSTVIIINSNGYETRLEKVNGKEMVYLQKDGVTQRIKLSTWNTRRKYFEKKYGYVPVRPVMKQA